MQKNRLSSSFGHPRGGRRAVVVPPFLQSLLMNAGEGSEKGEGVAKLKMQSNLFNIQPREKRKDVLTIDTVRTNFGETCYQNAMCEGDFSRTLFSLNPPTHRPMIYRPMKEGTAEEAQPSSLVVVVNERPLLNHSTPLFPPLSPSLSTLWYIRQNGPPADDD